jgi:hypothetical protein
LERYIEIHADYCFFTLQVYVFDRLFRHGYYAWLSAKCYEIADLKFRRKAPLPNFRFDRHLSLYGSLQEHVL